MYTYTNKSCFKKALANKHDINNQTQTKLIMYKDDIIRV